MTNKPLKKKIFSAGIEYFSNGIFVTLFFLIYSYVPYYANLLGQQGENIIRVMFFAFSVLGPVYFIVKHIFFRIDYTDNKSFIALSFMYHSLFRIKKVFRSIPLRKEFLNLSLDAKVRTALLSVLVKFFFFPLMISFLIGNFTILHNIWLRYPTANIFNQQTFSYWTYDLIYNSIFCIDTAIFCFGYAFEAKWLKNEIKSVDPYLSGWAFALICYPPFNSVVDTFSQSSGRQVLFPILGTFQIQLILKIVILVLYAIYVSATIALFTKSSNLTNRGIIGYGPYKFIRHPAYASKNLAWWLEKLPYFTSWVGIISLLAWNIIYIMRALTEERHLLLDPSYKEYAKKVPYRFIPYII